MKPRAGTGKPAEISFTSDFHELPGGELRPGAPLLLRYDPHRIVPHGEAWRFGDPQRPVIAHVQFHPNATPLDVALRSPAGIVPCPDIDSTGQGSMLSVGIDVPADAEFITVWFSFVNASGTTAYDSDDGSNFRFGFACREIDRLQARIARQAGESSDRFSLILDAAKTVTAIHVQFVRVGDLGSVRTDAPLRAQGTADGDADRTRWGIEVDVAQGAVLRFRLCYWIAGRRLVDDNSGDWYLAPLPEADLPPPPQELLDAAAAWR
ncbi:MAG: hypothetical protein IPK66_07705 [Rhodospirillales bacterium]|nr:hypothetical protein [Rhodospirillales bacterium]